MRKFKQVVGPEALELGLVKEEETEQEDDYKLDVNSLDVVLERIEGGLIGTLRIEDEINKPLLKKDDLVHIRTPQRIEKRDILLYKTHDEYFLRRVIKFKDENIYVAGDNEHEYHIIHKSDVIGKVIGRQRRKRYKSFTINPNNFYNFKKVNLAYFRLKDRILDYEDDINSQALEAAMQIQNQQEAPKEEYHYDFDLDKELEGFLNPDELVKQYYASFNEVEEVQYVDEFGNPIDPNEISDDDEILSEEEMIEEKVSKIDENEAVEGAEYANEEIVLDPDSKLKEANYLYTEEEKLDDIDESELSNLDDSNNESEENK